jgi:membrane protein required for colicin V production
VIIVIILVLVIQGLISGFIRGIFDLCGIIIGLFLAFEYAERLKIAKFLAFILIFLGTVIIISILGRIISKLIHLTPLGVMDRLLGGGLGFIKGIFFSFVFLLVILLLNKDNALQKCDIAPLILKGCVSASQVLPEKWYKWIKRTTKHKERLRAEFYEHHYLPL